MTTIRLVFQAFVQREDLTELTVHTILAPLFLFVLDPSSPFVLGDGRLFEESLSNGLQSYYLPSEGE